MFLRVGNAAVFAVRGLKRLRWLFILLRLLIWSPLRSTLKIMKFCFIFQIPSFQSLLINNINLILNNSFIFFLFSVKRFFENFRNAITKFHFATNALYFPIRCPAFQRNIRLPSRVGCPTVWSISMPLSLNESRAELCNAYN